MKIEKAAGIPLITHDPYFSVWSLADKLYEADTQHWSQEPLKMYGSVLADEKEYFFMGRYADRERLSQKSLEVTATSTVYTFENEKAELQVSFTSPLLADDLKVFSRPCTYIRFLLKKKTAKKVSLKIVFSRDFVKRTEGPVFGGTYQMKAGNGEEFSYVYMYKGNQHILGESGDNQTIDWGNLYLAAEEGNLMFRQKEESLRAEFDLEEGKEITLLAAFDDILSINYLGDARSGYWKKFYRNLPEVMAAAFCEKEEILEKCQIFDKKVEEKAEKTAGKEYAFLCAMSYRQVMAGHKLISDSKGRPVFLSKECDSNGCIGTVDVSYPSVPLLLCVNPELAKGILRPIFAFASLPVWCFDFAPHDVGRYPYATGQIYGLQRSKQWTEWTEESGMIYPFYANYPDGKQIYDFNTQMPVEESGNMLIMTAVVCKMEKSTAFAEEYLPLLQKWVQYLIQFGKDPQEQLCTDDFAGHLNHNVNLSAKAIMGIEAYGQILRGMGKEEEYQNYHRKAKEYAAYWEKQAAEGDHTLLAYDQKGTWSLKYNLIWDKFFESEIFSDDTFKKEVDFYRKTANKYGVPLDSRKKYTKSDWLVWCAAMADDKTVREELIMPIAKFLRETRTRVPFSDWYDTETGDYCHFKGRTVQGGIFMPILLELLSQGKK